MWRFDVVHCSLKLFSYKGVGKKISSLQHDDIGAGYDQHHVIEFTCNII